MIEANKKIWSLIEDKIGRCILFKDAAMKEVLGEDLYTLQFATLSVPEKVDAFLESAQNIKIIRKELGDYIFTLNGVKVEIHCFNAEEGFENSYAKMFNRTFRCENLGINIMGQFNKNLDAYNDIKAKEVHFSSEDAKISEQLIGKLVRYVMKSGFTIGDDIMTYIETNQIFRNKVMRNKFFVAFVDCLRKNKCSWERIAEALKLIKDDFQDATFIQYTTGLDEENKNDRFIRNYLYNLFITLNVTGQELQRIMPNEPTLEYFDSLAINVGACLGEYKEYIEIKNKYGEDFLELLMDVQESVAMSLGMEYVRVSDETFDMGELFFKDERFWCTLEDMKVSEEVAVASTPVVQEEAMDVSKGNAAGWIADKFNNDMYSDADENDADKVYLDDEVETETADTGIDMSALDAYEEGSDDIKETDEEPQPKVVPPKQNEGIMNSQRGHESTVLNSGGV